ncbi:bifunctional transcriptional activator/DNA repair enzyme AdaA [Cerasicoccus maritimus]|uniref:bifunctional transcriptional activator/DNA repair enzyme AdaA n=1 Tax=Cerasicoccus maritimus TaxID=490089 RepID=UPI0028529D7B|nr:methylated-DNA--[protein]-cysteine S-methyltransferase [Cerasicoccus maritimus]
MTTNAPNQEQTYATIARAIAWLQEHYREQPTLDEVAASVSVSPFHFQRLFTDWTGVSPKKFLQHLSLMHAKQLLRDEQATLFDAALATGFSGPSRLHDLFVNIEQMTPGEYKNGGAELTIDYALALTPFGQAILAATPKGLTQLGFVESLEEGIDWLREAFPKATLREGESVHFAAARQLFRADWSQLDRIKLHLKGTPFQLKVWQALLQIPSNRLETYGSLAQSIGDPKASRAVGTAVGANPISYLIPCHRVIRATGEIGGYHWNPNRKRLLIAWDQCAGESASAG